MCGIIGVFNRENSFNDTLKALEVLKNRGKDNFGIYCNNKIIMSKNIAKLKETKKINENNYTIGHCLHSIVSFVAQPLETNNSIFTTNCEIYNWKELNEKYSLNVNNDSEIILKLIEKIGIDKTLNELDGVYAFAHLDKTSKILTLARDIIGEKPIWYSTNSGFLFASEKKALEKINCLEILELNPRKILQYNITTKTINFIEREFLTSIPESKLKLIEHEKNVEELLISAIKKRIPDKKFGILFSGGVDSTTLAYITQKLGHKFTCYTAVYDDSYLATPKDLEYSLKIAKEYNFPLKVIKIKLSKVEAILKKIVPLIEDTNVTKVGVALTFYEACKQAKKDGCKVIFSGLGSEEIFAGYDRHKKSSDINKECISGLLKMYERDLYRDDVITMNNSLELRLPFLDIELAKYSLKIPSKYKIDEATGESKIILRRVARNIGLNEEFSNRKKTAAQYGSNFHKALVKLTKTSKENYISSYLRKFYPKHNVKLGVLLSSGKDSVYSMHIMQRQNYSINCAITIKSKNPDSYMFHTPNINLAELQAKSIGIPLIIQETQGNKEDELSDLKEALKKAKDRFGIEGIVTGALYSSYQRDRIEKIADSLGLKIFAPLWHISQENEIRNIMAEKFKIVLSSIAADGLNKDWLNKILTQKDVDKLVELNKQNGINVAGEGGEYESLVLDAPMFNQEIIIDEFEIISENNYTAKMVVKKAHLKNKNLNDNNE